MTRKNLKFSGKHQIIRAERLNKILDLRRSGKTLKQIAEAMNCSIWTIQKTIVNAIKEVNDQNKLSIAEWMDQEWAKTEALLDKFFPAAMDGDFRALEAVLKLLERRAKYRGLDAPAKVAGEILHHHGQSHYSREQMVKEIRSRLAKVQAESERTIEHQPNPPTSLPASNGHHIGGHQKP